MVEWSEGMFSPVCVLNIYKVTSHSLGFKVYMGVCAYLWGM